MGRSQSKTTSGEFPAHPDVVVIGAGAAGIAAARTLRAQGVSVVVVEAAGRAGGRAFTESQTFGTPFDHGCAWLQGPADWHLPRLAHRLGMNLHDHDDAEEILFVRGRPADDAEQAAYADTWTRITTALRSCSEDRAAAAVIPPKLPFSRVVETWIGPMDYGVDLPELSTADFNAHAQHDCYCLVAEGLGTLVTASARGLPIRFDAPATRIAWNAKGVRVDTAAGTLAARACIVTVSVGVLASGSIRFDPPLPDWKHSALEQIPMGMLVKIALQFDGTRFGAEPFQWLTHAIDGPRPADACFFLAHPFDTELMVGFVGGRFGWELSSAGPAAAIDFALERLASMLGSHVRRHFVRGHLTDWASNSLTLGAYAAARPGQQSARMQLARPLGGSVFFAGEALSGSYDALCAGAWLSGENVALEVATALNGPGR